MSDCPIKGTCGLSWYPGHIVFITPGNCLETWTESPGPPSWMVPDVGRLCRREHPSGYSAYPWRACASFRWDSEISWPKVFLDSATAAKWHNPGWCHLHCGRYEWRSAQAGQLCVVTLALYSTKLEQGLDVVPGFLTSHQSHAETDTALQQWFAMHVWTDRWLCLTVGPHFLKMTGRDL